MGTTPKEKVEAWIEKIKKAPGTVVDLPPGMNVAEVAKVLIERATPKQTLTDIERTQLVIDALSGIRSDERLSRIICGAFALKGKAGLAASIQAAMRAYAVLRTTPKQRKAAVDELEDAFQVQRRRMDKINKDI